MRELRGKRHEHEHSEGDSQRYDDRDVRGPPGVSLQVFRDHVVQVLRERFRQPRGPLIQPAGGPRQESCRTEDQEDGREWKEDEEKRPHQEREKTPRTASRIQDQPVRGDGQDNQDDVGRRPVMDLRLSRCIVSQRLHDRERGGPMRRPKAHHRHENDRQDYGGHDGRC